MNTIEERVRAATRAAADTVPPDSVPPLRLRSAHLARSRWDSRSFASLWAPRLAPVAAALAVVTVAIAMVVVGRNVSQTGTGPGSGSSGPGQMVAGPPASSYVASGLVPRYYVTIESHGNPNLNPSYAVVRATATGAAVATIQPAIPHGTIVAVTFAADDQRFVLDEQPWTPAESDFAPRTFYMYRLDSSGHPGRGAKLRLSVPRGELMTGFALSPGADKLAIAVEPDNVKSEPDLEEIRLYNLPGSTPRIWSAQGAVGFGGDDARSLSWADNGRTLAFDWTADGPGIQVGVRLLNTDTGGGNLLADSRPAVSLLNQRSLVPVPVPSSTASPGFVSSPGQPLVSASGLASAPPSPTPGSALASPAPGPSLASPAPGPTLASPPPERTLVSSGTETTLVTPATLPYGISGKPLACQEDSILTPDGSVIICGAIETLKTILKATGKSLTVNSDVETGFLEYSTATGKVTRILGHWRFDNVNDSIDVLWTNSSGSVLIGVIPSAHGNGRVGIISGNQFTPLPTQSAPVSPDSGTW